MAITCQSNEWLDGYFRWEERLLCPLSCRWRSDWHPCHPASQSLTSMPACFTSLHYRQTSGIEGVLKRAVLRPSIGLALDISIHDVQFRQLGETCGGDWRYRFVGRVKFAACSARRHVECLGLLGRDNRALASTIQGEHSFRRKRPIVFGLCG